MVIIPRPCGERRRADGGVADVVTFSYQVTIFFLLPRLQQRLFFFSGRRSLVLVIDAVLKRIES